MPDLAPHPRTARELSEAATAPDAPLDVPAMGPAAPTTAPDLSTFGARLALIRWRMRWNQKEAAIVCRISQGTWRDWELSERMPRDIVEVARKISWATGIDAYWILTGQARYTTHTATVEPSQLAPLPYKGVCGEATTDLVVSVPRAHALQNVVVDKSIGFLATLRGKV